MTKEEFTKMLNNVIDERLKELKKSTEVVPITSGGVAQMKAETGQYASMGAGMYKTSQGSVVVPDSSKNNGQYWKSLSQEMENFAENLRTFIKTGGKSVGKSLNTVSDTEGGFLVPAEFVDSVIMFDTPANILLPMTTIVRMNSNKIVWPRLQQITGSPSTQNFFGGVTMAWAEDNATLTETEPNFEDFVLETHKLNGLTRIDNTLVADSAVNIINFVTMLYRDAINYTLEDAILRGNGVKKPLGIFQDPGVTLVTRNQSNLVDYSDILNLKKAVPSYLRGPNTCWVTNEEVLTSLQNERDNNNNLILQQKYSEVGEGTINLLLGYKVKLADGKTPSLGTRGDISFGNWTHYWVAMRDDVSIASSEHRYFDQDRMAMRVINRADGRAAFPKAFSVLGVSASGS